MTEALEALRSVYAQPVAYAAARKASGQRVVGYFCDSLPVELIEAADLLPLRVTGYPAPSTEVLDKHLFALLPKGFWQVRQSSLEFLNHSFGRIIDGTYAMLDVLVIPNTRKPLLNMYGQLRAAQAAYPDLRLPHLIVLDRAATRVDSARAFNHESIAKFRTDLEAWMGAPIKDGAIKQAIAVRRETARNLRTVLSWRKTSPAGISGSDILAVIGSAMFMPSDTYGELIRRLVEQGPQSAHTKRNARVFIGGSPPDNALLYNLVENLGATIVGEDHCWGERYVDFADAADADSMTSLAQRWDCSAACGFRLPFKATTDNIVRRAKAACADAVILSVFRHDETQIWDTPGQITALQAAGLPVLHLAEQPHVLNDSSAASEKISSFLGGLLSNAAVAS
jgi:benzoyl-CoA reductase/2-hydroxyglutaryl-CoA dehydratase subunit BcrC/BadD/HgdB